MSADADCTQLANLVRITHKYQFRNIMTWALSALYAYYSRSGAFDDILTAALSTPTPPLPIHAPTLPHTGPGLHTAAPSQPPTLEQLTELAALCERADLLEATIVRWKRLIGEGRDLALAISVGERFNLRPVVGLAYHALMLRGKGAWDGLARAQRVRLLAGHYALCKLWDALPAQPPPLIDRRTQRVGQRLLVAGDHRDTGSIQGALVSGHRAAAAADGLLDSGGRP